MGSSDGEGDSEEEIKEIPLKKLAAKSLKQSKRAKGAAEYDDEDDSSEEEEITQHKNARKADKEEASVDLEDS